MRLYHPTHHGAERASVTSADEEDCFTRHGRRRGIWLTTEPLDGASTVVFDLPDSLVKPFETTGVSDAHRTFVVPFKSFPPSSAGRRTASPAVRAPQ